MIDEDQIVERVNVAMFAADRGGASEEDVARVAWGAAKAALAEATRDILRDMEAAARVAQHETIAAPNAPGWPATCAVLRHLKELRELLTAAPDQR